MSERPGVYLFKDEAGKVLYVGKAASLRNRIRSYFASSANLPPKIVRMVAKVADFEYIVAESESEALILECNHDRHMLEVGPYPPQLKRRVGGNWGHLANVQAAALLRHLGLDRLQRIVCSHLSEHNNRPELALEALTPLLDGDASRLTIAAQDSGLQWQAIR